MSRWVVMRFVVAMVDYIRAQKYEDSEGSAPRDLLIEPTSVEKLPFGATL